MNIRTVLLWETIRYEPCILFTLESMSKAMHDELSRDLSYIHYFLEETFGGEDIRDSD